MQNFPRRALQVLAIGCSALAFMASAATLNYPGPAPCATTLQACINGAAAGDTVQLATNTEIVEFVEVTKSLIVKPLAGFRPRLQGLIAVASTTNVDVTVQGITVTFALSGGMGPGGGNLTFRVLNNDLFGSQRSAVEVYDGTSPGVFGTKTAYIIGNRIVQSDSGGSCASAISVIGTSANFSATITGNQITATNLSQCAGIEAVVGAGPSGTALIDRNRITGSNFDQGIEVRNFGANVGQPAGLITAQVSNNLVAGQNGNVGAPGSIIVSADGNNAAANVQIVNNTVANGRTGIFFSARTDLGAVITGGVHNNIAAFMSSYGIGIDDGLPGVVNSNNLVFGNADNFFTPGPGTRTGDPLFVNAAARNYALAPGSDAIDRGLDSALPAGFTMDLAAAPRRAGVINIGAYELTAALRDFDGGGRADVLLRNKVTGQNIGWLMNGLAASSSAFLSTIADLNWEVKGIGDFNGDGRADVLWRNKVTGQNIGWLMNGLTITSFAFLSTIADLNWEIKGVGDFNGDGRADVIWRNKVNGQNIGWLMNGLTVSTSALLPTIADVNWDIKGVGDFDGDGKADVILRNGTTGASIGWLMNGLTVANSALLFTVPDLNWEIKGVGDFNYDGKADLIWRHKLGGQNYVMLMNGLSYPDQAYLPTIADLNWEIRGVADFNGDNRADVILRNKVTGQNIGWLMNGLTISSSAFLPTIADTNWEIVGQQ